MISDSDSPCILAVTIFLSLFFGVTFPSLLLFLSRKNSLQFIVHQGGSISSLLPWEREREVLMEPRSYHSPGEGCCGGWRRKMSTRERRMVPRLAATLPIWALNGKSPPDAAGAAHRASSWLVCRTARFQSFTHGLSRTGALIHAHALSRYPPPVQFCHRTSTVISFGPCGFGISVTQELGVHTCNLFQSPSFRLKGSLCK